MAKHIYDENGKYKGKILSDEEQLSEQRSNEMWARIQSAKEDKLSSLRKEIVELGLQKEAEKVKREKGIGNILDSGTLVNNTLEIDALEKIIKRYKSKKKKKELNEFYKKDAYEKGVPLNVYMKKVRRRNQIWNIFITIGFFLFIYLWIYLAFNLD